MNIEKTAIAVALATTDKIVEVLVADYTSLGLLVKNTGANPFDAFQVVIKTSANSPEFTLLSASGDYTTPLFPLWQATDLTTLAAGAVGRLFLDLTGIHTLILKASAGVGATTADVFGQLS